LELEKRSDHRIAPSADLGLFTHFPVSRPLDNSIAQNGEAPVGKWQDFLTIPPRLGHIG
jgi:hypothetical protein